MPTDYQNNQYALALHQAGNLDAAKDTYEKILSAEPNNIATLHLLGILMAQQKEFTAAYRYIKHALDLEPDSATLHNSMGNVLKHLNDLTSALNHYKIALKLQPDNAALYNNLAIIHQQLRHFNTAIEYYCKAITIKPDYADAHYNLGLVLLQSPTNDDGTLNETTAIEHFKITIKLQPQHAQAHCQLAQIYQQQNNIEIALHHYQRTVRIDKNNITAQHNLGTLLLTKNKIAAAILHFKKTIQLEPLHREAFYNLGVAFLLRNDPEAALKYFLQLAMWSKDFDVYYNLGTIYSDLGRLQDAINYFNEALQISPTTLLDMNKTQTRTTVPDLTAVHINLGAIYLKQQNYTKAQQHYETALRLQPNNQEITYILAGIKTDNTNQTPEDVIKSTPTTAPREYVQHLFDNYARTYDQHLAMLEYRAPQLLYDAIVTAINPKYKSLNILDLGCGTGLCGEKIYPFARQLIGVDLSTKMLTIAAQKNIYTALEQGSIEEILTQYVTDKNTNISNRHNGEKIQNKNDKNQHEEKEIKENNTKLYKLDYPVLMIAGDTLSYIGDLTKIFALSCALFKKALPQLNHKLNTPSANEISVLASVGQSNYFVFTIEKTSIYPYQLQRSLRFAHAPAYIEELAQKNNFKIIYTKNVGIRKHRGTTTKCLLYVLQLG